MLSLIVAFFLDRCCLCLQRHPSRNWREGWAPPPAAHQTWRASSPSRHPSRRTGPGNPPGWRTQDEFHKLVAQRQTPGHTRPPQSHWHTSLAQCGRCTPQDSWIIYLCGGDKDYEHTLKVCEVMIKGNAYLVTLVLFAHIPSPPQSINLKAFMSEGIWLIRNALFFVIILYSRSQNLSFLMLSYYPKPVWYLKI